VLPVLASAVYAGAMWPGTNTYKAGCVFVCVGVGWWLGGWLVVGWWMGVLSQWCCARGMPCR
jgi:hypothetical protein